MSRYALAKTATPLLNTPHFFQVFGGEKLPLDEKGLFRPLEMIALPRTKFKIEQELEKDIVAVTTRDYPYSPLYTDRRFLLPAEQSSPERKKRLPKKSMILKHLENSLNLPYIWGGNWGKGIPELQNFYQKTSDEWQLAGVDCSGLLYEATSGFTPRNTHELLNFGSEIQGKLKPLDLIIWPGHVIIVFDQQRSIESLHGKGVIFQNLHERLKEIPAFTRRRFIYIDE